MRYPEVECMDKDDVPTADCRRAEKKFTPQQECRWRS